MGSDERRACSLPWCRQSGAHLTFEKFPDNEIRQMQWMALLDVLETWKDVPPDKLKDYLICNLHFDSRGNVMRATSTPLVTTTHVTQTVEIPEKLLSVNRDSDDDSAEEVYIAKSTVKKRKKAFRGHNIVKQNLKGSKKVKTGQSTFQAPEPSSGDGESVICSAQGSSADDYEKLGKRPKPAYKPKHDGHWTRESFSLGKKIEILRMLDSGMKQADVCRLANLRKSTVWCIWKNKEKIEAAFMSNAPNRKKLRTSRFQDIDAALSQWYNSVASQNVTVTGRLLQAMAESFAENLGKTDFVCTAGWLERFKQRHSIVLGQSKKSRKEKQEELQLPEISATLEINLHDSDSRNENGSDERLLDSFTDSIGQVWAVREACSSEFCDEVEKKVSTKPKEILSEAKSKQLTSTNMPAKTGYRESTLIVADDWINFTWPKVRTRNAPEDGEMSDCYAPEDIYSAVEVGILFRITPEDGWKMLKNRFEGPFNVAHERLTIILCANSDGSDKRRLCVFSQHKHPSCITSIVGTDFSRLPVDFQYTTEQTSWITEKEFENWIQSWDNYLNSQKRRVLLVIEALPLHRINANFSSINIASVPSHICHALLPFHRGLISEFKSRYRRIQLERIIYYMEQNKPPAIPLLDATLMLNTAWCEISRLAIQTAFHLSGIESGKSQEIRHKFPNYSFKPLEVASLITKAKEVGLKFPSEWTFEDFVSSDDCLFAVDIRPVTISKDTGVAQGNIKNGDNSTNASDELSRTGNNSAIEDARIAQANGAEISNPACQPNHHVAALTVSEIQIYLDVIKIWAMSKNTACPQSVHSALSTIESFAYDHS